MAIHARDIGKEFVKILGLPKETIWFEIRFHVDEAVSIKCEHFPSADDIEGVKTRIREYQLVEIDGGTVTC